MTRSLGFLIAIVLLMPAAAVCQEGARRVCPRIVVTCPTEMSEQDEPLTFGASVSGGDANAQLTFNWTTSAGTIISGQGTPSMILDTVGLGGQNIKVTVEVGGLPESCAKVESCEAGVKPQPACGLPFDHYAWGMKFNDETARLDNFAIALQGEPEMRGYIMVNPGRRARLDEVKKWAKRARAYLTNKRGIDPGRFVIVYGGDPIYEGSTMLLVTSRDVKLPFPGEIIK
jgi:hypothetical protein